MLENILNYETLVDQYEKSSGEKYPSDLKTATLLRCAPQKIREFLQLTLRDDVTYMDMKEALLSHERITKGYSQEAILKQLSAGTHSGQETSDATPMEVDRVYEKGKGKEKGKKGGDGKGKGWRNNMWQFPGGRGRGKGKGRGNFEGKSKGKGKKGKKGGKVKGKSKNKHGGGKGSNKDACFVCGSYDHWSRDCPRKVNNVNNVYYDWDGNEVSEKYPSDLKTATLLRCAPQKIREFLQLTLRDDVTYMDMKEALLSHERITKGYSQEAILKQLSAGTHSGQETSDATPMEVDRVYEKGKGKDKGKKGGDGKGKGWWNNMWQFPGGRGRGKGKGRGNFKGKSKGKGKKGKKGGKVKGKSKNKHGGGKGSNKDACFVCGSYDHWSRDCPRKVNNVNNVYYDWDGNEVSAETIFQSHQRQPSQSVQNVQQGGSSASSTQLPTSSNASTSQRSTAASSSVRRVYDLGLDNNPFSLIRMVTSGFDHTVRCAEDADFFYDWFEGRYDIDENLCVIDEDISLSPASNTIDIDEDECLHVRVAVSEWSEPQGEKSCIILDSGSDVSLLPLSFLADSGNAAKEHNLRDCQGQKLHTKGTKDAELIVSDIGNMQAVLKQQFIVGDVTNCLLSLGQMLRKGWSISKTDECGSGLALISPDEELKVPVEYRGDSLSITAWIRCVTDDSEVCVAESSSSSMPSEPLWVQTVFVRVQDEFDLARKSDWELSETGTPYRIQQGRRFCDPRQLWGRYWPYRSTLIRKVDSDRWELVELSVAYHELDNCGASIPECSPGLDYEVLTIMAVSPHELSYVGSLVDEQPIVGVSDIPEVEGVGDPSAAGPSEVFGEVAAPQLEGVVTPDEIVINDIVLKPTSPVKDLRAASKFLGISQAGSKTRMFERICSCHILALRRRSLELAEQRYAEEEVIPKEAYSSTRQPSERERRLHEITHLPFRKWCPFCISGKSRADYKHPVGAEEVQQREHPVVQLDVMFGPSGNSVLLLIDTWTRFVFTAPMKTKSAKTVADAISEFLGVLGYFRKVEIVSDNEPVIISGVKQAQILRSRSGLETIVQQSKSFDKGRTAVAERAIQTVRAQGRTLVNYVEHQIAATFPDSHPLHLWAILHSAWLLNRFHLHSQLGCTPFQSLFGRPYKGRVANFGQDMYGISQKKAKYKAQWVKGIWVGKDAADQDILIIENDKILKSRAVRAIGTFWSKEDLINMEVSPDYMLKIATQTKGIYPVIPPLTCLPPRSDDEAASDPPDEQGGEGLEVPEMMTVPASAKVSTEEQEGQGPRLPISSRSPFGSQSPLEQRELSHLPFSAGILPEGDDGPVKRGLDAEDTKRDIKQPKVKSYSEKRVSFDSLESKEPKQSKTSLQSSPTFAGNIRLVTQYGDVDVYVEPDEDGFDAPHEECFLHLENELDYDDDLDKSDLQLENQGPPEMTDEEIAQLDRAASLEELDRLSNIGVISEYSDVNGEEMVLDTRLVYDWRFREGHWKRRARLVAREFRFGAEEVQQREHPVVQLDVMFGPSGNSVLLLIDTWTRFVFTAPMKTKSAKTVADAISEFLGVLGYFRKVEIVSDNEPVIISGVKQAQILRSRSGLETIVQQSKSFDKGRTAVAERAIQTVRAQGRTLVNYVEHQIAATFPDSHPLHLWAILHSAWLLNRFHLHSQLGCTPFQSLFGRPYKGRVANFGQDMYGISQKKAKYKAQWVKGIWVGKDAADQDILIIENDKILKSRAVRAIGTFWSKEDLINMEVSPDYMLKIATQTKGIYPVIPPLTCLPPRSDDEAASDPPDEQGGEGLEVPEMMTVPASAKVSAEEQEGQGSRLPISSRSPFGSQSPLEQRELSHLPFSAGILPEGDDGPVKRGLDAEDTKRDIKQPKVKSYSEKRVSFDSLESKEPKQSKTSLQSSPTFAGNIRLVTQYGDVDVYVEPDEDGFDAPHEECFLHLENELDCDDDLDKSDLQLENQGPPEMTDEEIAQLDRAASLEELDRLSNIGVISEYSDVNGEEMVLDTRLVYDWRFREGHWKRRARLVAREFRCGDASNEETFSPTSSKWIIHMLLVVALVQQLSVLIMDVKDAFLTVPQRDLVIVQIPVWAQTDDMITKGIGHWKLLRCLPGQRRAALHWHEHFESTVNQLDFISFEGMVTVYKHKVKQMYITIHVDDLLVIGSNDDCNWFKEEISKCFTVKSDGPYSTDEKWESQYLKRTLTCNESGIVVEPNKKYIPKLLELLKIENRRGKSLPHHAQLESYSAERVLEKEKLGADDSRIFRGGLGICLYLAQDRPDVQESVRTLWGRRHQPHFEFEADNYPTDESLTRTFRQMIVMSLCLDRGKVREVEQMLLMIENDGNNDEILAGLTSLEEYMDPDMNLDMTLQESIAWLYHRFRPRLVGPQYDKVRWAAEVFSSPEESMRVSQERALEAIEHRMEIAYVTNDQAEYEALERYRDRIGML
eukprot:symbB.v1.2.039002.t1/scaffold6288.1/size30759/2